jgi:hypothetical protein
MGESSKIVPALGENCFLQDLHFQICRVEIYECFSRERQRGHSMPLGQRIAENAAVAKSGFA